MHLGRLPAVGSLGRSLLAEAAAAAAASVAVAAAAAATAAKSAEGRTVSGALQRHVRWKARCSPLRDIGPL